VTPEDLNWGCLVGFVATVLFWVLIAGGAYLLTR